MVPDSKAKRQRVTYLSVEELWRLAHAVRPVQDAFGGRIVYLVGSALESPDYRDVDIRIIINDEDFDQIFIRPDCMSDQFRMLIQTAISAMLRQNTNLPVDFQVQSRSEANQYDGRRYPVTNRPYVDMGFVPKWDRVKSDNGA